MTRRSWEEEADVKTNLEAGAVRLDRNWASAYMVPGRDSATGRRDTQRGKP